MANITYEIKTKDYGEFSDGEELLIIYLDDSPFPAIGHTITNICVEDFERMSLSIENLKDILRIMEWWVDACEEPEEIRRVERNTKIEETQISQEDEEFLEAVSTINDERTKDIIMAYVKNLKDSKNEIILKIAKSISEIKNGNFKVWRDNDLKEIIENNKIGGL